MVKYLTPSEFRIHVGEWVRILFSTIVGQAVPVGLTSSNALNVWMEVLFSVPNVKSSWIGNVYLDGKFKYCMNMTSALLVIFFSNNILFKWPSLIYAVEHSLLGESIGDLGVRQEYTGGVETESSNHSSNKDINLLRDRGYAVLGGRVPVYIVKCGEGLRDR